jgi:hypothetical protein
MYIHDVKISGFTRSSIFPFGKSHKLELYSGAFAHFGVPLGPFGVQGSKIKFYSGGFFPFEAAPKLKIYSGGFWPVWCPTGAFGGSGVLKISANGTRKQTQY